MSVFDEVHESTGLRSKSPNLAIGPPRNDTLTVWHELQTIAEGRLTFVLLQCDPQKLFLILDVPNSNLILYPHGENLSEPRREANTRNRVRHRSHKACGRLQTLATFDGIKRACSGQCINLRLRISQTDNRTAL